MSQELMYHIMRYDPDGWSNEPTRDDYDDFRAWVVTHYGTATYEEYMRGGWMSPPEV